jgi:hypothetical protein
MDTAGELAQLLQRAVESGRDALQLRGELVVGIVEAAWLTEAGRGQPARSRAGLACEVWLGRAPAGGPG